MEEIVFFGFCTIFTLVATIYCVRHELAFASAVTGILLGIFSIGLVAFLLADNITYNYAIIELPNKTIVEGDLDDYDYLNDRIRVVVNGTVYEVDSDNCTLFVK